MDSETDGPDRRRRVHGMLKLYYGLNEEGKAPEQPESLDPCDINGPHFEPEHYLNKVTTPAVMSCSHCHTPHFIIMGSAFSVNRAAGCVVRNE